MLGFLFWFLTVSLLIFQFEKSFNLEEARSVLSKAEGCKVIDERKDGGYITPFEAEGKFETYISRMRVDHTETTV